MKWQLFIGGVADEENVSTKQEKTPKSSWL
jgi:hypothetical protein